MEGLGRFNINFAKLKLGKHHYDFSINDEFFEHFEHSLIEKAEVKVDLELVKEKETLLDLHFALKGKLTLSCDRCLDEYDYPINNEEQLIVKLSDSETKAENDESEEVLMLGADAIAINVAKPVFDFLNLAKPMKPQCQDIDKSCNKEMMEKLAALQKSSDEKEDIDPRWEKLRTFFNQNNN